MIVPPVNVRVMIAAKPVDFRKGMDGLAALITAEFKLEPYSASSTCSAPNAPTE